VRLDLFLPVRVSLSKVSKCIKQGLTAGVQIRWSGETLSFPNYPRCDSDSSSVSLHCLSPDHMVSYPRQIMI
jgi:hypothetical protein